MKDKPAILLVDDQIQNIELLEAILEPQGYEIVKASNGGEALVEIYDNQIDLILLDIMMPDMDGFEVTRRIRHDIKHRHIPIILVTALRETEDRVRGIEAGCDDFISKPVDKIELLARVRSLLKVKAYNDLMSDYRKELESEVAVRTGELAELNAGLEIKVYDRTAELQKSLSIQSELNNQLIKTAEDLEKGKEILKQRNKIMEHDLDMARKIQNCFVPDVSPAPYIAFYYKPMEKVGGDFFDFIRFPDSDNIGIFISDVSGHGVPAAFITAMIKSSILQYSTRTSDPAGILEILNDTMINQSADNFVTAFYGCYKPGTGDFVYSGAGHNPPYIITSESIEYLSIKSQSPPLAIMDNMKLKDLKRGFINEKVVLKKGSKIILYTDGLTEAININERRYVEEKNFQNGILKVSFRKHFNKPAEEFIKGVYQDLVELRGSDYFDDDVCIICMDIE
jgi:serine phosphatase RsbU (regulator of sigma subunit)